MKGDWSDEAKNLNYTVCLGKRESFDEDQFENERKIEEERMLQNNPHARYGTKVVFFKFNRNKPVIQGGTFSKHPATIQGDCMKEIRAKAREFRRSQA